MCCNPVASTVYRVVVGLCLAVLFVHTLSSRADAQGWSSRGREFWIAFMPTNGLDKAPRYKLFIVANKPTNGSLTYVHDRSTVPVVITGPGAMTRVDLDTTKLAPSLSVSDVVSDRSAHLVFDADVTVYAFNMQTWSSDGFLALPTTILGYDYVISSYPNTIVAQPNIRYTGNSDFPSQFCVLAVTDRTNVAIMLSDSVVNLKSDVRRINRTLNAGDVLMYQASGKIGATLSGSNVHSNKPVVVYGGHQRANIPYNEATGRDHLVEQLLPVEHWAREAIVVPLAGIARASLKYDVVSVVAANTDTRVTINGVPNFLLSAGGHETFVVDRPMLVAATKPIQVAYFRHSSDASSSTSQTGDTLNDPFMVMVPAPEQFDTAYVVESVRDTIFNLHYLTVIAPVNAMSEITVDGGPIAGDPLPPDIGGSGYTYAHIQVGPGTHSVRGAQPFGLIVYGYGLFNSYGYVGGLRFGEGPLSVPPSDEGLRVELAESPVLSDGIAVRVHSERPERVRLELYDMRGALVASAPECAVESGETLLRLEHQGCAVGTYLLRVAFGSGASRAIPVVLAR